MEHNSKDFAIILTWPDATIRGDERWMMFFKKIGLVKNLNFKVGHTGIIIINHKNGEMLFYDFGRYITPRGYGRARSSQSDPLIHIDLKAKIIDNKISNIAEIVDYLEILKPAMYGEGKLYFSIVDRIDFKLAKAYGDQCVLEGTYPYGAIAKNNNNCSRFITRMLMKSSPIYHFWHPINFPETIKASPISNLVNTAPNRMIYSYDPKEGIKHFRMNRFQSLWFLVKQLGDNVYQKRADLLPPDQLIGAMKYRHKPTSVPKNATYLGGVGDGAWYDIERRNDERRFTIKRMSSTGEVEYTVIGESEIPIPAMQTIKITYDSHRLFTHILVNGKKIRINHIKNDDADNKHITVGKEQEYA